MSNIFIFVTLSSLLCLKTISADVSNGGDGIAGDGGDFVNLNNISFSGAGFGSGGTAKQNGSSGGTGEGQGGHVFNSVFGQGFQKKKVLT